MLFGKLTTVIMMMLAVSLSAVAEKTSVIAGADLLWHIGVKPLAVDVESGASFAKVSKEQISQLKKHSHHFGRCGGFEAINDVAEQAPQDYIDNLMELRVSNDSYSKMSYIVDSSLPFVENIKKATEQVKASNLEQTVKWLSGFDTRYYKSRSPNNHVGEMHAKLSAMVAGKGDWFNVDYVDHRRISQKSLRVRILGSKYPDEIVVLGGHLDSITFGGRGIAPGADDNASGSANLVEAVRILSDQARPERTIEFFWYAGEEGGLIGSAEIAKNYKSQGKTVIGVMQLDMTLYPGNGSSNIGTLTDFTSSWLREVLVELNRHYVDANLVETKCGYGCSDHASWHRQGFPAIAPFEATVRSMNGKIHTVNDVINSKSDFEHSAQFSRLAIAFAMSLGNSRIQQPY